LKSLTDHKDDEEQGGRASGEEVEDPAHTYMEGGEYTQGGKGRLAATVPKGGKGGQGAGSKGKQQPDDFSGKGGKGGESEADRFLAWQQEYLQQQQQLQQHQQWQQWQQEQQQQQWQLQHQQHQQWQQQQPAIAHLQYQWHPSAQNVALDLAINQVHADHTLSTRVAELEETYRKKKEIDENHRQVMLNLRAAQAAMMMPPPNSTGAPHYPGTPGQGTPRYHGTPGP
jgi:hypothetical protein